MKYFIVVLLFFIALTCEGQVCIKPETARFYLEIYDENEIRKELLTLDSLKINNLETRITLKDSIITTFQRDSLSYNTIIVTQQEEITYTNKEIRVWKNRTRIVTIVSFVLLGLLIAK